MSTINYSLNEYATNMSACEDNDNTYFCNLANHSQSFKENMNDQ